MKPETTDSKAKGGHARADALTPDERQEIARKAALARWDRDVPIASHEGTLKIGGSSLTAAVLPNGMRVLTQGTFLRAIGRSRSPKAGTGVLATVDGVSTFLQAEILKPFVSEELMKTTTPVFFRDKQGRRAVGYDAELLPAVAEVYLKLRDACEQSGLRIPRQYRHIIRACDAVLRALAKVGIVALVDEATGYQEVRDRLALQAILDTYLRKELAAWAKRFPDEFYQQIFRLKKWEWRGMAINRPQVVGKYTIDLVYSRLAPGLLKELETRNPVTKTGSRKVRHHQWLTEDVGDPALAQHLYAVLTLMRIANSWDELKRMVNRAFPKREDSMQLKLFSDPATDR
jgi:hypothetical protein